MTRQLLRPLGPLALLAILGAPTALALDDDPGGPPPQPTQICDDAPVNYSAPSGTASGTGRTPQRASMNAQKQAAASAQLSVTPCASCPDGKECRYGITNIWDNNQSSTVWDAGLGLWKCTVNWDGCEMIQRCHTCS